MCTLFACKLITSPEIQTPVTEIAVPPSPISPIASSTVTILHSTPSAPQPIRTSIPPTSTFTPPTETITFSATQPTNQSVQIFLIGLEDSGKSGKLIGCNDSAISVIVNISPTKGVLRAALDTLLSLKDEYYGQSGLYNALYQSDLGVDNVTIEKGEAIVYLSGKILLGGECDNPRVEAQIKETALQFSTVSKVTVYINGKLLEKVISLK